VYISCNSLCQFVDKCTKIGGLSLVIVVMNVDSTYEDEKWILQQDMF